MRGERGSTSHTSVRAVARWLELSSGTVLIFSPSTIPGSTTVFQGRFLILAAVLLLSWAAIRLCLHRYRGQQSVRRGVRSYSLVLALVAVLLLVGIPNSPSRAYGWSKTSGYVLKVLVPGLFLLSLGEVDAHDLDAIVFALVLSALVAAVSVFREPNLYGVVASERPDTIGMGRILGSGIVAAIAWLSAHERSRRAVRMVLGGTVVAALLAALMACGQRGPLLAVLLSATVIVLWPGLHRQSYRGRIAVLLVSILMVSSVMILLDNPLLFPAAQIAVARLRSALITIGQGDDALRWEVLRQGLAAFWSKPLMGVGTGGYLDYFQRHGYYLMGSSDRLYPHNLLVEFAAEQGLVGLAAVTAALYLPLGLIARLRRRANAHSGVVIVASLFVFALANSMVSGDLLANCTVFVWGFLVIQCGSSGGSVTHRPVWPEL
jgi:O-antigen ligase